MHMLVPENRRLMRGMLVCGLQENAPGVSEGLYGPLPMIRSSQRTGTQRPRDNFVALARCV